MQKIVDGQKTQDGQAPWARFAGMGIELFGAVAGFTLLGLYIDWRYDTGPTALLICAILGIVGGLYNLIRTSLKLLKPPDTHDSDVRK